MLWAAIGVPETKLQSSPKATNTHNRLAIYLEPVCIYSFYFSYEDSLSPRGRWDFFIGHTKFCDFIFA